MGLQQFERRLERLVEGVFAKAFRSGLQPVELGRRLTRVMDADRTVGVRGVIAPNRFTFALAPSDHERFASFEEALVRELADAAREYARDEGYGFMGPVQVELEVDEHLRPGRFAVDTRLHEGRGGMGAGTLILPSGDRLALSDRPVVIGRLPECDITLSDPNVSRRHAEVRPSGTGFAVTDLGSTNGTRVNSVGVPGEQVLRDGDVISVGATRIRFEAS
jgi:hypothetical protein